MCLPRRQVESFPEANMGKSEKWMVGPFGLSFGLVSGWPQEWASLLAGSVAVWARRYQQLLLETASVLSKGSDSPACSSSARPLARHCGLPPARSPPSRCLPGVGFWDLGWLLGSGNVDNVFPVGLLFDCFNMVNHCRSCNYFQPFVDGLI